jgi:hypothetical protein
MTEVEHWHRAQRATPYLAVYLNRNFHALSSHANFIVWKHQSELASLLKGELLCTIWKSLSFLYFCGKRWTFVYNLENFIFLVLLWKNVYFCVQSGKLYPFCTLVEKGILLYTMWETLSFLYFCGKRYTSVYNVENFILLYMVSIRQNWEQKLRRPRRIEIWTLVRRACEARTVDNNGDIEPRQRLFVGNFNELCNDVKKVSKLYL